MRCSLAANLRIAALAMSAAALLPIAGLQAQQPPPVKPGTEATGAVGSQVEPMKPECETATGERQQQHPPTAGLSEKVPTMTPQGDCPDPAPRPQAK